MIELPFVIPFGDYIVKITQGHYCFRWDIYDALDNESLHHSHCETIESAISEAFETLNDWKEDEKK